MLTLWLTCPRPESQAGPLLLPPPQAGAAVQGDNAEGRAGIEPRLLPPPHFPDSSRAPAPAGSEGPGRGGEGAPNPYSQLPPSGGRFDAPRAAPPAPALAPQQQPQPQPAPQPAQQQQPAPSAFAQAGRGAGPAGPRGACPGGLGLGHLI